MCGGYTPSTTDRGCLSNWQNSLFDGHQVCQMFLWTVFPVNNFFTYFTMTLCITPRPSFLPKVVSVLHLIEDIVLPFLCPAPKHPKEVSLHCLDIWVIKVYPKATAFIRQIDSMFVFSLGPRKGHPASKATIEQWIRNSILRAYAQKQKLPLVLLRVHSTGSVWVSWASRHQASVAQLCKAATWSSVHTSAKFYQVDVHSLAYAAFSLKVFAAALWTLGF